MESGEFLTLWVLFQGYSGDPCVYSCRGIKENLRVLGQWAWKAISRREQRCRNLKWGWPWLPPGPTGDGEDENLVLYLDLGRGPKTTQIHQAWSERNILENIRPCVGFD